MKAKYAHLLRDGNVIFLTGNDPETVRTWPEDEQGRAHNARRLRACGYAPFVVPATAEPTGPMPTRS